MESYGEGRPGTRWVALHGDYGLGKSHLMMACVGQLARRGVAVRYWRAQDLETAFRNAIDDNSVSELLRQMMGWPILAIDDLGTQQDTDFIRREFLDLLDRRYVDGKATLLTINTKEWRALEPRLKSRLSDFRTVSLIHMTGADVRPRAG